MMNKHLFKRQEARTCDYMNDNSQLDARRLEVWRTEGAVLQFVDLGDLNLET